MDELDEQLKQLSLINGRLSLAVANKDVPLGGQHAGVAKLVSSIEERSNQASHNRALSANDYSTAKKVGPLVPPKPHKKLPSYSESLDSSDYEATTLQGAFSRQPLLLRKQSSTSSCGGASPLLTSSKVTLDNPAVLEQQLEALEYHKKQLEKKGMINNQTDSKMQTLPKLSTIPKLSSTSFLSEVALKPQLSLDNSSATYANMRHTNSPSLTSPGLGAGANYKNNVYSNMNNIYSNVQAVSPSQTLPDTSDNGLYFSHNMSLVPEDEIPPPPSPVSSSYSELRRATDVFKTNNPTHKSMTASNDQMVAVAKPISGYGLPLDHKSMKPAANDSRHVYMNKQPTSYMASNMGYSNYNNIPHSNSGANSDFYGYGGGFSQTSSTYESIYEPINPRPPSQMSTHSNNTMYPTCSKGGILSKSNSSNLSIESGIDSNAAIYPKSGNGVGGSGILHNYSSKHKEDEVEALTDYLVQSMDAQQDLESYGICFKCKERVVGENSGCTAMDQIYHIACFTCSQCQINLQGKPFYTLEGKPYCEYDYLQTLEKCSVCMSPILERILRATGKPYHPQCFTCVVCKKSLDGIPFTVDATNQNYCIEDFHRKFAPCCCVCKEPIMPEPGEEETVRVVALDRSFHFECYKCEDCGLLLSSEAEGRGCYPLDDHVLCKSCNAKRVQMLTNCMGNTTEL